MPQSDPLRELLAEWEEAFLRGEELSPETLCRDSPELLEPLRRQIQILRAFESLDADATAPDDEPSPTIDAPPGYEITRELGRGGMGAVYEARHVAMRRQVALKVMLASPFAGPAPIARFRVEAEACARVRHPNVVTVYESGEHLGRPFIVMELVAGGSLADLLSRGPLDAKTAATIAIGIAEGVQALHTAGIVHRDLKPGNVLMDVVPKVTDFGLAKMLDRARGEDGYQTASGAVVGTPHYMAPEQAQGDVVGASADIYAIGGILYSMLVGRPPFEGDALVVILDQVVRREPVAPRALRPGVPRDLETICLKCLEKVPRRRYSTAAAVGEELRRFLAGRPIAARPVSAMSRGWRWAKREPRLAAAAAVAAVGLFLAAGVGVWFGVSEAGHRREAERRLAESSRDRGLSLRATDPVMAALWFARALAEVPPQLAEMEEEIRLELAAALAEVPELDLAIAPGMVSPESVVFAPDGRSCLIQRNEDFAFVDLEQPDRVGLIFPRARPQDVATWHASTERVAVGGQNGWRLWDASTGKPLGDARGPDVAGVRKVADGDLVFDAHPICFSLDGKFLLVSSTDGSTALWEVATGERRAGPWEEVSASAFSPDGRLLAVAPHGELAVYDTSTGKAIPAAWGHVGQVAALAFSGDGKFLLAGTGEVGISRAEARLWEVSTGTPVVVLPSRWRFGTVALSADGRKALLVGDDNRVRVWESGTTPETAPDLHTGPIGAAAFTPDGAAVVTASDDGTIRLWELPAMRPLGSPLRPGARIGSLGVSVDGMFLLAAAADGVIRRWRWTPAPERGSAVETILPFPGGAWVRSRDGSVRRWAGKLAAPLAAEVTAMATSPLGRMATAGKGTIRLWSPAGEPIATGTEVKTLAFLGENALASIDTKGQLRLWELASGTPRGPARHAEAMAPSPDGRSLVVVAGNLVERIDASTGARVGSKLYHDGWSASAAAWSPDGSRLATASWGFDSRLRSEVRVWDVATGVEVPPMEHPQRVTSLGFSPDGGTIVSAADRKVYLWDAMTGALRVGPLEHPGAVGAVRFSPDGRYVAVAVVSSTAGRAAYLWDAKTGRQVGAGWPHPAAVLALEFAADGRTVITGCLDGGTRSWTLPEPLSGSPAEVTRQVERHTGLRLDADGTPVTLRPSRTVR